MDIEKLIKPESVAVVGVTDRKGSFGCAAAVGTSSSSISDRVYYVHPARDTLNGRKCYKSLDEIEDTIDCVIICTPRPAVVPILKQAGKKGIKAAIVYASGFAEEHTPEGLMLEKEMEEICTEYGMVLLGPNCAGILNNVDNINLWGLTLSIDMDARQTGIGIVAQSGFIAQHIMMRDYMNVSYCISSGNGNIVKFEEYLDFLVNDDNTKVIALYIEGVKDGKKFTDSLRTAAEKRKPVIVLKTGKSEKGAAATASHTGNLAGSDSSFEAVFKKYGVIRVRDLEEFMTTAQMFSVLNGNYPKNNSFCGINLSGGENAICADLCEYFGINLPDLKKETVIEMGNYLPGFATAQNPLDATTDLFRNKEAITGIIKAARKDDNISAVVLGTNIEGSASPRMHDFTDALVDAAVEENMFPIFAVPSYEASRNKDLRLKLEKAGIPLVSGGQSGYSCISYLAGYSDYRHEEKKLEIAVPDKISETSKALTEADSKEIISEYGIRVPKHIVAHSEADVLTAMEKLKAPYVMKISSPDILHKTDAGAVKLGIGNYEEAVCVYDEILSNCRKYNPEADLNGVLIQETAEAGLEMIVGVKNDPTFGPVVLVGMGGVFVEVFKDVALYPAPLNIIEAHDMVKGLKAFKLLSGYRGGGEYDIDALCNLIVKVSNLASENKNKIKEIDLNPVFVYGAGKGVCAVDALIIETA